MDKRIRQSQVELLSNSAEAGGDVMVSKWFGTEQGTSHYLDQCWLLAMFYEAMWFLAGTIINSLRPSDAHMRQ